MGESTFSLESALSHPSQVVNPREWPRALIAAVLAVWTILALPLWNPEPPNEDVAMVTIAARTLAETGSLGDVGLSVPFQTLRPEFNVDRQPFWYNYVGPVLLLSPFYLLLGDTDLVFRIVQSLWLGVLWLCLARQLGSRLWAGALLALAFAARTLDGAIQLTPSQLPAIALSVYLWGFWSRTASRRRALVDGALVGLGLHFRPEVLILFAIGALVLVARRPRSGAWSRLGRMGAGAALAFGALAAVRMALGAVGSSDHTFYTVGTSIFAPGFQTLSLPRSIELGAIWQDANYRAAAMSKVGTRLADFFTLGGTFWSRYDAPLVFVAIVLAAMGRQRLAYGAALALLLAQVFLTAAVIDIPRYHDGAMLLFAMLIALDVKALVVARSPRLAYWHVAVAVALLAVFAARILDQRAAGTKQEKYQRKASADVHALVPADAFVISDDKVRWRWYGHGARYSMAPWSSETMVSMLGKFPGAYVILFFGPRRIGAASHAVVRDRPLLSEPDAIPEVYGPSK